MASLIEINLTLVTDNPAAAYDAYEKISRLAAGFGFDGIRAETSIDRIDDLDDDDDEDDAAEPVEEEKPY